MYEEGGRSAFAQICLYMQKSSKKKCAAAIPVVHPNAPVEQQGIEAYLVNAKHIKKHQWAEKR